MAQINAFEMAQRQFDQVADQLKLDDGVRSLLRWPLREFHFAFPVRMSDRQPQVFRRLPRPAQRRARAGQGAASAGRARDVGHPSARSPPG